MDWNYIFLLQWQCFVEQIRTHKRNFFVNYAKNNNLRMSSNFLIYQK